jgi:hypothetical protein
MHPDNGLIYLVEWDDSRQPTSEWTWLEDVKADIVKCRTIGFMVEQDEHGIAIAMSLGDVTAEKMQGNGIMRIPRRAITVLHILENPIKKN